jgi:hypothetical protein
MGVKKRSCFLHKRALFMKKDALLSSEKRPIVEDFNYYALLNYRYPVAEKAADYYCQPQKMDIGFVLSSTKGTISNG